MSNLLYSSSPVRHFLRCIELRAVLYFIYNSTVLPCTFDLCAVPHPLSRIRIDSDSLGSGDSDCSCESRHPSGILNFSSSYSEGYSLVATTVFGVWLSDCRLWVRSCKLLCRKWNVHYRITWLLPRPRPSDLTCSLMPSRPRPPAEKVSSWFQ